MQTWITSSTSPKALSVTAFEAPTARAPEIQIRMVKFYGKSIPCVVHNLDVYVAIDTLRKIHFGQCISTEGFQRLLQAMNKVSLVCLRQVVNMQMKQDGQLASKQTSLYVELKDVAPYMEKLQKLLASLAKGCFGRPLDLRQGSSKERSRTTCGTNSTFLNSDNKPSACSLLANDNAIPLDLSTKSSKKVSGTALSEEEKFRVLPRADDKSYETPDVFLSGCNIYGAKRRIEEVASGRAGSDKMKAADGEAVKKKCSLESTIFKIMQKKTSE